MDNGEKFVMDGMLRFDGGKKLSPKATDPVHCADHNVTVQWGDLSLIQQIAVAAGLDVDGECILLPQSR